MFDFDDYENLENYTFTYPVLELLKARYVKWLKTHSPRVAPWEYRQKLVEYVKEEIVIGHRKYGEFEPAWETLLFYIKEVESAFECADIDAVYKALILYDQVLMLLYEGHPLPPNLTT